MEFAKLTRNLLLGTAFMTAASAVSMTASAQGTNVQPAVSTSTVPTRGVTTNPGGTNGTDPLTKCGDSPCPTTGGSNTFTGGDQVSTLVGGTQTTTIGDISGGAGGNGTATSSSVTGASTSSIDGTLGSNNGNGNGNISSGAIQIEGSKDTYITKIPKGRSVAPTVIANSAGQVGSFSSQDCGGFSISIGSSGAGGSNKCRTIFNTPEYVAYNIARLDASPHTSDRAMAEVYRELLIPGSMGVNIGLIRTLRDNEWFEHTDQSGAQRLYEVVCDDPVNAPDVVRLVEVTKNDVLESMYESGRMDEIYKALNPSSLQSIKISNDTRSLKAPRGMKGPRG